MYAKVSSEGRLVVLLCVAIAKAHSATWAEEHTLASAAYEKGDYSAAEQHDRAALAAAESFGENDLRLEATLTQLGAVLQARAACCDAEVLLRRALAIRKAQFGPNSIETALGETNLASVWQQAGRKEDARKLQAEALATAELVLKPDDPKLVPYLALSALTERDALHYDLAEELLKRASVLAEKDAIANPRRLLQVWRYLGSVYWAAGRFDDAGRAYKNLISLSESKFGANSLDTANALASFGGLLCARKFYAEGRPYLARALDIFEQLHETNVQTYVDSIQNIASAELYLGQSNSAEQHAMAAVKILENKPNTEREAMAVAYNNLGQVYAAEDRFKEAERATLQAKEIWIAVKGRESARVAAAISNLGALNVQQHKYKKAEALYLESAGIISKVSGAKSVDYALELNRLGVLYNYQKRFPEAEQRLRQALEIDSKKLGSNSPLLAEPYLNLAASLHGERRRDEALECYKQGIDIMTNAGQRNAPSMAPVLDEYSALLREMERWADAEQASTEALGIRVKRKVDGETYR